LRETYFEEKISLELWLRQGQCYIMILLLLHDSGAFFNFSLQIIICLHRSAKFIDFILFVILICLPLRSDFDAVIDCSRSSAGICTYLHWFSFWSGAPATSS